MYQLYDTDVDFWLREEYPLTVIGDRYGGTYSKSLYLAFPYDFTDINPDVNGGDVECMKFWETFDGFVGKGATVEDAVKDLHQKLIQEKSNGYLNCKKYNSF